MGWVIVVSVSMVSPAQADVTSQVLSLEGDGSTVPTYLWSDPAATPKAIILGLHGGVQHGRNYEVFAKTLAPRGFVFYAIDFRGHGQWLSESKSRPSVNYYDTSQDVVKVALQLRQRHPDIPLFCIGESLGAAVAMKATSIEPKLFDGMILVSAGVGPAAKYHTAATINSIRQSIKTLGGTIDVSPHLAGVSDDQRSTDEMLADPLGRRKSSVWSLLHTVIFLHSAQRVAPRIHDTPILVMLGDDDHIVDPDSTKALYLKLGSKDKTLKVFPKAGHLLVTTQHLKDEVVATVEDWLAAQIKSRAIAVTAQSHEVATTVGGLTRSMP
jgi:alpha-beta hydrolase superfamily lysophospholipase